MMNKSSIITWIGLVLTVLGGVLFCSWGAIFNAILSKELPLTPKTLTFREWREPSMPITLTFYFFNWTNPEDILDDDYKPKLVEIGPYTFREHQRKVNITWNDNNNTITYLRQKFWHFQRHKSIGSLKDNITTLNPIAVSAAYVMRNRPFLMQLTLSSAIRMSGQKVWITKTAGEMLFEGYSDSLLTLGNKMPQLSGSQLPFDKFSWFPGRNGSATYDGVFNIDTGLGNLSRLSKVRQWNYRNTTVYKGSCGAIGGTDGTFFPPGQTRERPLNIFISDMCRSVKLEYSEDAEVAGIPGYRYTSSNMSLDNGELNPDNKCFCDGDCPPSGALNVSQCQYGAPGFLSFPHFLHGDSSYVQLVEGLSPQEEKHRFEFVVEPTTGLPLDVTARFQLNLLLQPSNSISLFSDVPKLYFPILWLEETVTVPADLAALLKILLLFLAMGSYLSVGITLVGLCMMGYVLLPAFWNRLSGKRKAEPRKVYKMVDLVPPLVTSGKEQSRGPHEEHALISSKDSDGVK